MLTTTLLAARRGSTSVHLLSPAFATLSVPHSIALPMNSRLFANKAKQKKVPKKPQEQSFTPPPTAAATAKPSAQPPLANETSDSACSALKKLPPPDTDSRGKIVAVTSGKGGVGKTTSAASFAMGIAAKSPDEKVCVIDFDIGLRNLDIHLGSEVRRGKRRRARCTALPPRHRRRGSAFDEETTSTQ